jgi:hypothetical protein
VATTSLSAIGPRFVPVRDVAQTVRRYIVR